MTSFIQIHEAPLRLGIFAIVLLAMMALEALRPKRDRVMTRRRRWTSNLALVFIDGLVVRLLFPVVAAGVAMIAARKGWGLFNWLDWPIWAEILLSIIVLDMLIYWQHVLSHRIPIFWAFHKVHHADRDIDVTTGSRFHPAEIVLSMVYKIICVLALGPAAMAVILFEVLLNACAMFNHANLALPKRVDARLRKFIVTPDMHRVHHSVLPEETHQNFGFCLSIWDNLFRSYTAQPRAGHADMTIGLPEYQTPGPNSLTWSLALPFRRLLKLEDRI